MTDPMRGPSPRPMFMITSIFCALVSLTQACEEPRSVSLISTETEPMSPVETDDGAGGAEGMSEPSLPGEGKSDVSYLMEGQYIVRNAHANILRSFMFFEEDAEGHIEGYNLDGLTTTGEEEEACGIADKRNRDGEEGIDNQFGVMWKLLEPLVGDAVRALLQNAINDGRLLMMVELTEVDDLYNDDQIGLNFFRGRLKPIISTQGLIVPDQTFYVDYDSPSRRFEEVQIIDGLVEAAPVEFVIPIEIFDANFDFFVREGRMRLQIHEDGSFSGVLGGVVNVQETLDQFLNTNARSEAELVQPIFQRNADLGYVDGRCSKLSMAIGFSGVTAFVVREELEEARKEAE